MQSTIRALIAGFLLFLIMTTKGFRISFWNVKLANSDLSRYLMASCLEESIAYIAVFSSKWLPATTKWSARTFSCKKFEEKSYEIRLLCKNAVGIALLPSPKACWSRSNLWGEGDLYLWFPNSIRIGALNSFSKFPNPLQAVRLPQNPGFSHILRREITSIKPPWCRHLRQAPAPATESTLNP